MASIFSWWTNVYDLSRKVANELENRVGDMIGATAIITIATKYPDALGVTNVGAAEPYLAKDGGILLLSPLYSPLPAPIAMIEPVVGQVKALLP